MKIYTAFILLFISQFSWSMTPFQTHIIEASKAFSSFYMYEHSEGDPNHLEVFQGQFKKATETLQKSESKFKEAYVTRWLALQPVLKYEDPEKQGLYVDARVRFIARTYLTDIYLAYLENKQTINTITSRIENLQILTLTMAAREIDLGGDRFAGLAISDHNTQIDSHKFLKQIHISLNKLLTLKLDNKQKSALRKVQSRISFIEKGIVENSTEGVPYYLVHSSVKSIDKLLGSIL